MSKQKKEPDQTSEVLRRVDDQIQELLDSQTDYLKATLDGGKSASTRITLARERRSRLKDALIDSLRTALKDTEWQPIETAPKDTEVLIFGWLGGMKGKPGNSYMATALCSSGDGHWVDLHDDEHMSPYLNVTHWRPLPSPPATNSHE